MTPRPGWPDLPLHVRAGIEHLVRGRVRSSRSHAGGFSPGLASSLSLHDGRRVFVKATRSEAETHRAEARVRLPATAPAPALLGSWDDGEWVALAFEHVDGTPPARPWIRADLERVLAALQPQTADLPRDHPRLGGWAGLDPGRLPRWAAERYDDLIALEAGGLASARGDSLVHFDLYAHNILLTRPGVMIVDWPHARLGAPLVDRVMLLAGAAADGFDPEPLVTDFDQSAVTAILAADAGFLVAGALTGPPGRVADAKRHLARGATAWLRRRLALL